MVLAATSISSVPVRAEAIEGKEYEILVDNKLEYAEIKEFHNGVAIVTDSDYNYGAIDTLRCCALTIEKSQCTASFVFMKWGMALKFPSTTSRLVFP